MWYVEAGLARPTGNGHVVSNGRVQLRELHIAPFIPAFLEPGESAVAYGDPQGAFRSRPALRSEEAALVLRLARVLGCERVGGRAGWGMVCQWLDRIRHVWWKFRSNKLAKHERLLWDTHIAATSRRRLPKVATYVANLRTSLQTYSLHLRQAREWFNRLHSTACVFPNQRHHEVHRQMLDSYKCARVLHYAGHADSEAELRLACAINAVCPHLFPMAQDQAQALCVAAHVQAQVEAFDPYAARLGREWARQDVSEQRPEERAKRRRLVR